MSVVCRSFRQNAWKKDLCSDCFRPENDHVVACVSSNGQSNLMSSTDWNGKVQALQSTEVVHKSSPNGSTNGYNNSNNKNNHVNSYNNNNNRQKKTNPTTTSTSTSKTTTTDINSESNSVTNGDIVNGKVAMLNQRNLDKSDDLFETVKNSINGSCNTNNGDKTPVIKSNSSPPITSKIIGILKMKSDPADQSTKRSVKFSSDPIVIGYCDDEDSGNEESEEELDYCDFNGGGEDDDDHSEEDSEFSQLTASNTRFNSVGANLRDAKILQTFGQINNQSSGIAFRIGDFKSETRKYDYDETLIGCNRVSELIGEEKRGKSTNGTNLQTSQTTTTPTMNEIKELSTSTVSSTDTITTTSICSNDQYNNINSSTTTNNNDRTLTQDEVLVSGNGGNGMADNHDPNGQLERNNGSSTNGKQEFHLKAQQNVTFKKCYENRIKPIDSDTSPSSLPIDSNVVSSSQVINDSSSLIVGTITSSSPRSRLLTTFSNDSNLTASTITHNNCITASSINENNVIIEKDDVNDIFIKDTIDGAKNDETLNPKSSSQAKIKHNASETIEVSTQHQQLPLPSTITKNITCASSSSSCPIVSLAPVKLESITVNVSSTLESKSNHYEITEKLEQSKWFTPPINSSDNDNSPDGNSSTPVINSLPAINSTQSVDHATGLKLKSINGSKTTIDDKLVDEMMVPVNEFILTNNEVENNKLTSNEVSTTNEKDVKSMNDETAEPIDECSSSSIEITDAISTTILTTSTDDNDYDDGDNIDDKSDDFDFNNEVNDAVLTSPVSLTSSSSTKSNDYDDGDSDLREYRSVESIDITEVTATSNNKQPDSTSPINQINDDSIKFETDEKIEIPKKPERSLKSSLKPKIPCKPLSLSNKVSEDDSFYGNGLNDLMNHSDNYSNGKHYEADYYRQTDSIVNQFIQSKSEFNPATWDPAQHHNNQVNHHQQQSSRELRLAELAQELESVRHPGKRKMPVIPSGSSSSSSASSSSASSTSSSASSPSIHEVVYERSAKFNTLSRANLPAPPPRPPPPSSSSSSSSGFKQIVQGVTNGYHGSNLFHSNGNKDKDNSNVGTKFSLKRLLKLSKDDNDLDHHSGETISGKIWKHKFDLDRRKSSPGHTHHSERSTTGSYEVNKPFYSSGRERSYSLSGNSCLSQPQQQLLIQQQKSSNGFRPIVPARRSRSSDINAQTKSSSNTNNSNSNDKSTPSSTTSPNHSTTKLTSSSDLILTNLNLDSAYTVIAKYNVDTINRILHNYSTCHQSYKNISKKDLFYESFRLIGSEAKIYKDAYLKSETISANFLVTPLAYSVRSEASSDLQYGQFIDSDENIKLFALKFEFDLITTLDRLLDEDYTELTGSLSLKAASFIILQFICLLKYYQSNGLEEIHEEQLKLTMLCCNRKQTNNSYLISPSFDYVSNVYNRDHSNSHHPSPSMSLCKCVKELVKNLRRKLTKSDDLMTYLEDTLDEEKSSSLSTAKTICEMIFFEVPLNFESPGTLELWLDIQRTKFINSLNYESETESAVDQKTVHNYYFMLFLTRSNIKLLFQCINQIRSKLLNQMY